MSKLRIGYAVVVVLVTAAGGWAAPPALDIPAEVRPAGEYVRFTPKTDGVSVTYVGLSGLDPFPSEELKDGKRFLLHTRGIAPGKYKFAAVAAGATGEQARADFTVVIEGDPLPPIPNPPVPPGPNPPGPVPADSLVPPLYVLIVEESGARTPAQGKVIADAAVAFRGNGTTFRVFDKDDPAVATLKLDTLAKATGLPAVIVRDSRGVDRAFKLPASQTELATTVKGLVK